MRSAPRARASPAARKIRVALPPRSPAVGLICRRAMRKLQFTIAKQRHLPGRPAKLFRFMKLSILMPVYNERTVVERCISLVLAARLPENMDRELVIVDDCSTDGTRAIIDRLALEQPRIKVAHHPVNAGKTEALKTGFALTTGQIVIVQDAVGDGVGSGQ